MKTILFMSMFLIATACTPDKVSGEVVDKEYRPSRIAMMPVKIGNMMTHQYQRVPERWYLLIKDSIKVYRYRVSEKDYNTFVEGDTVSYGQ